MGGVAEVLVDFPLQECDAASHLVQSFDAVFDRSAAIVDLTQDLKDRIIVVQPLADLRREAGRASSPAFRRPASGPAAGHFLSGIDPRPAW